MTTTFKENYSINTSDDSAEVQSYTSFIYMKDGKRNVKLNCQKLDQIIASFEDLYDTDDEPELFLSINNKTPWYKHFEVNRNVVEDILMNPEMGIDDTDDAIDFSIREYLEERNNLYHIYYDLDSDCLDTYVYSYNKNQRQFIVMLTPSISKQWDYLKGLGKFDLAKKYIRTCPLFNSKMNFIGLFDDQSRTTNNEEINVGDMYRSICEPDNFKVLCDVDRKPNREFLTTTLIDLMNVDIIVNDIDMFKDIGLAYLSVSDNSVPYAMYRWKKKFKDYIKDGYMIFKDGTEMSLLDMRDHLNRSKSKVSWKTMEMYLRQQDPELANKWRIRWYRETTPNDNGDHYSVSLLLYKMCFDKFIFSPVENEWFLYDGGIWTKDSKACSIGGEIPTRFVGELKRYVSTFSSIIQVGPAQLDKHIKMVVDIFEGYEKVPGILTKLNQITYINNVITMAKSIFSDVKFASLLDTDINVLNTPKNIIIFNDKDKPIVRTATGEDYVSKCTGVNYNTDLTWESRSVVMAQDLLNKLFPIKETRHEVLKVLSYLLYGGNRYKKFIVMTGPKDTGKSTFKKFLCDILSSDGNTGYSRDVPVSVLVKENDRGAPSPEIVQCTKTKVAWFSEPDGTVTFNNGLIKGISGGDSFFARGLYQAGGIISPDFKMVLICNGVPPLKNFDRPTLERFLFIPFSSIFVNNAPEDEEEQYRTRRFPLDPDFYKQNDMICEGLLWIMIQYSEHLEAEGLCPENSEEMMEAYEAYERLNNKFAHFVDECVESGDDNELDEKTILMEYKSWYKKTTKSKFVADTDQHIIREFEYILGAREDSLRGIERKVWPGYRIKSDRFNSMVNV